MVQLMVKFTARITFAFILPVNFNSKIDSKICLQSNIGIYFTSNIRVYFTGKIEALLLK